MLLSCWLPKHNGWSEFHKKRKIILNNTIRVIGYDIVGNGFSPLNFSQFFLIVKIKIIHSLLVMVHDTK
jgi:hypothetical protein